MSAPEQEPRRAAALRYSEAGEGGVPKVVATGAGHLADRIVEIAREAGVPVRSDPLLAQALGQLELDERIPRELYAAVAETLVWAYALDARSRSETS
jgi:flagellar biosynthesis protein